MNVIQILHEKLGTRRKKECVAEDYFSMLHILYALRIGREENQTKQKMSNRKAYDENQDLI